MSGAAERLIIADTIKQFPGTGDIPHTQFNTLVNLLYESLKHTGHKRLDFMFLYTLLFLIITQIFFLVFDDQK